ncbi:hypothetical protein, partial [Desertihabitans aurantiacus]|uniref:hypothetical protein n=1 Tax=Desertihabitans aurantiacus TaxID=2282477 RepID=UPI001E284394
RISGPGAAPEELEVPAGTSLVRSGDGLVAVEVLSGAAVAAGTVLSGDAGLASVPLQPTGAGAGALLPRPDEHLW